MKFGERFLLDAVSHSNSLGRNSGYTSTSGLCILGSDAVDLMDDI